METNAIHIILPNIESVFVKVGNDFYQAPVNLDGSYPQWPGDMDKFSGEIDVFTAGENTILILRCTFAWLEEMQYGL